MTYIKKDAVEKILVTALNSNAQFLSGLTDVLIQISRKSDGYFLDFYDNIFKNSGWINQTYQMVEVANLVGSYFYDFDTTGFDDDIYFIRVTSATAKSSPWEGELRVGGLIDELSTKADIETLEVILQRLLGLNKENQRILHPIYNEASLLTSATIKIYSTASDCNIDSNAIATYSMVATYNEDNTMASYKVTKN
jgi:hypothetical protein